MKILPDSNQPAPDVCIGRSLESKDNTPEADETKVNKLEVDENEDKSDNGKDTETDDDTIVSTVANPSRTTSGKSKYSCIREANIAQNKEILGKLGLQSGFSQTLKAAKKIPKKKEEKATAPSSSRLGTSEGHMSKSIATLTSAVTNEITGLNGDSNVAHQVKDVLVVVGDNINNSPPLILQSDPSANGTTISDEPHQTPELTTSASTITNDTSANGTISAEPHQNPELTTPVSTVTNDSGTMDIVPPGSDIATELTSNPDPMEVVQEKI